jgi:hypothetical protein
LFLGAAQCNRTRLSKGISFLAVAKCCGVLRRRWRQRGVNSVGTALPFVLSRSTQIAPFHMRSKSQLGPSYRLNTSGTVHSPRVAAKAFSDTRLYDLWLLHIQEPAWAEARKRKITREHVPDELSASGQVREPVAGSEAHGWPPASGSRRSRKRSCCAAPRV